MSDPDEELIVYAVVYSNYDPAEVHSLWATEALAEEKAEGMEGPWEVVPWTVETEL